MPKIYMECDFCKEEFFDYDWSRKGKYKYCSRPCLHQHRSILCTGPNNPRWLGEERVCECGGEKDYRAKQCMDCSGGSKQVELTDELREIIATSYTYREIGQRSGHDRKTIARIVRREGLNTDHLMRARKRASTQEQLLVQHDLGRNNASVRNLILRENLLPYVCKECGLGPEWQGKTLTLELDHINGDYQDDRLENLRFLCPNCHTQTATWKNRKNRKDR